MRCADLAGDGPVRAEAAGPDRSGAPGGWRFPAMQDNRYHQIMRYRSARRYADGNPLAVIDSEMPGLWQRLGLMRAGSRPDQNHAQKSILIRATRV